MEVTLISCFKLYTGYREASIRRHTENLVFNHTTAYYACIKPRYDYLGHELRGPRHFNPRGVGIRLDSSRNKA